MTEEDILFKERGGQLPDEGQIEADWQLEIQLNGCTLMVSTNGVLDLNVDLWIKDRKDEATYVPLLDSRDKAAL